MGSLDGKVAFITGVARGQGRSHAERLASEGADIIGLDICEDIPTMDYPNASEGDLEQAAKAVESYGRRMLARKADVRDAAAVQSVADDGFDTFGRIDIALSNAGIVRLGPCQDADQELRLWEDTVATNLTGAFHVVRAVVPRMIAGERGVSSS